MSKKNKKHARQKKREKQVAEKRRQQAEAARAEAAQEAARLRVELSEVHNVFGWRVGETVEGAARRVVSERDAAESALASLNVVHGQHLARSSTALLDAAAECDRLRADLAEAREALAGKWPPGPLPPEPDKVR